MRHAPYREETMGELTGVIGVAMDITVQMHAEAELAIARRRLAGTSKLADCDSRAISTARRFRICLAFAHSCSPPAAGGH